MRETDLYKPVKDFLIDRKYEVKSEVGNCDVMALKDNKILIVELKLKLNLDVILQAADRQRYADTVYMAIPKKSINVYSKRWKNISYLLRRLEIGVLAVSFKNECGLIKELLEPKGFSRPMSKKLSSKKRKNLISEFNRRSGDYNTGGSTKVVLVTAYREMAIHIAALLKKHEQLSIKQLKELGTDDKKTARILQDNHYNWFERVKRGTYCLTERGLEELSNYVQLVELYLK